MFHHNLQADLIAFINKVSMSSFSKKKKYIYIYIYASFKKNENKIAKTKMGHLSYYSYLTNHYFV